MCNNSFIPRYEEIPAWEPPTPEPYKPLPNLQYWLLDPDAFDQYIVRNDSKFVYLSLLSNYFCSFVGMYSQPAAKKRNPDLKIIPSMNSLK